MAAYCAPSGSALLARAPAPRVWSAGASASFVGFNGGILRRGMFLGFSSAFRNGNAADRFATRASAAAEASTDAPVDTGPGITIEETDPIPYISDLFTNDENDPDVPTEGYSSISDASKAIKAGKFVILVDLVDGRSVGYLVMAASMVTPDRLQFVDRYCMQGLFCVLSSERLDELQIGARGSMTDEARVSVDERSGTATGASVGARTNTVLALLNPESKPDMFVSPGYVYPLRYQGSGKRAGTPEAALDLITLNRLPRGALVSQLVYDKEDLNPRLPKLQRFSKENLIPILSVTDLNRYFAETTLHNLTVVNWIMKSLQDERERLQKETGSTSTDMKFLIAERDRLRKERGEPPVEEGEGQGGAANGLPANGLPTSPPLPTS
ncbi:probable bifunctional riboflavin biosynthesis protein RIBA 1, chloroplastic [Selaginella moellendorffii]|uniref:probable bifunctional riboflavin biosynthesis protein RIBA 1, chloroplastic n=1 Tax=Selaginella moellendorffii TaxID=88036 RepID=UPI000D1CD364|nr:probable bifunctional riboflavin biosynthesis protein RIBA 1, chloroplastic [Selaginella moellendorffii]|eukprot:XP_024531688.1 probable bifunctional riboflavin biosynthesis protein RIBA 1, chloroplastic [Selaginella moellendorffii]